MGPMPRSGTAGRCSENSSVAGPACATSRMKVPVSSSSTSTRSISRQFNAAPNACAPDEVRVRSCATMDSQ